MNPLKLLKYAKFFSSSKFLSFASGVGKNVAFLRRRSSCFIVSVTLTPLNTLKPSLPAL